MALFLDLQKAGFTFDKTPIVMLDNACVLMEPRGELTKKYIINNKIYVNARMLSTNPSVTTQQPYLANNIVVIICGKITNYTELRSLLSPSYVFKTYHDAELVMNMYRKFGSQFVGQLLGQFSFVLYDITKSLLLTGTDHAVSNSLYCAMSENKKIIAFASELKALTAFAFNNTLTVERVLPGKLFINDTFFTHYNPSWMQSIPTFTQDSAEMRSTLRSAITDAVKSTATSNVEIGVLLSGGLDSAIVTSVLTGLKNTLGIAEVKTYSIGLENGDDMTSAEIIADHLQTNHTGYVIGPEILQTDLDELIYRIESYDVDTVRSSFVLYMLTKWVHEDNPQCKILLSGDMADDIFAGHDIYATMTDAGELFNTMKQRISDKTSCLRTHKSTACNSIELRSPFTNKSVIDIAMTIDPQFKLHTPTRIAKQVLRDTFADQLPAEIVSKPKKSAGLILSNELEAYAQANVSDDELANSGVTYPVNTPMTKEALLYRRIFESYFTVPSQVSAGV